MLRALVARFGWLGFSAWLAWSALMFGAYWPAFVALPALGRTARASPQMQAAQAALTSALRRAMHH